MQGRLEACVFHLPGLGAGRIFCVWKKGCFFLEPFEMKMDVKTDDTLLLVVS